MTENKGTILFIGNHFQSEHSNVNVWQELPNRLRSLGWKTMVTSDKRTRTLRLLDMLWTILSKRSAFDLAEVDVFSGASFLWAELCVLLLKQLNKPIVLVLHGGDLPEFVQRYPHRAQRVLSAAAAVTAPSAYLQTQLSHLREDIQVIPNPIEVSTYPFRHRTEPRPNLVWVRAFHEIYNPSLAPRMLAILLQAWPETHLTMVGPDKGDGSLRRMQKLAVSLGVQGHINIVGGVPREEVPIWLDQGDIFINTTNYDNTPVSVIEAMACGLSVVSTDVGGIPYLVEHDKEALLVPYDDPIAMYRAIYRIRQEPGLAARLSSSARQKAEGFDWLYIIPHWESLFTHLIISLF